MKPKSLFLILMAFMIACSSSREERPDLSASPLFEMENLLAWCIIPYDNQNRTPRERAEMLNDLGFTRMAYDWRDEHLPQFSEEMAVLNEHHIALDAAWLWVDRRASEGLLPEHDLVFGALEETGASTTIWLGIDEGYYDGLDEAQKVEKLAELLRQVRERALLSGSTIALYNHGGWIGVPENQVRVIEASGHKDIGIVFNFHHGHDQIDRFEVALRTMMPYLKTVNLNGMEKDGAHILDIGKGDHEKAMIRTLIESGFDGTIGIIGHTEGEDVRVVLKRNLDGLQTLLETL